MPLWAIRLFISDERKRYVAAMLRAIEVARVPPHGKRPASKTDGLRVIHSFEEVNGIAFNPFDQHHLFLIEGNAGHEQFFRRVRLLAKKNCSKPICLSL